MSRRATQQGIGPRHFNLTAGHYANTTALNHRLQDMIFISPEIFETLCVPILALSAGAILQQNPRSQSAGLLVSFFGAQTAMNLFMKQAPRHGAESSELVFGGSFARSPKRSLAAPSSRRGTRALETCSTSPGQGKGFRRSSAR
ncbi:cbhB [Symbiodinium necroappetens]|uniref:CbhB protein n=1 Tax=Symbiodinium necroappetens TaxID=1628268 RepID=A0A812WNX7_9DINO|nr:cbhB [Symbiodinium necroappetens]